MGLAEVQGALAKLYVDPALRGRFFDDPAAVGAELGLDAEEARGLAGISRRQVEQFAESLRRKRRDQVRRVVPLAARALGGRFAGLFERYAAESSPRGPKADLDDAIGFVESGGFFVSFMTGNSTRLAVGVADWQRAALLAGSIIAVFVTGVVAGSLLAARAGAKRTPVVLLCVALLLAFAATLTIAEAGWPTILCLAFAMGIVNAAIEGRDGAVVESFTQRIRNWLARVCAFG